VKTVLPSKSLPERGSRVTYRQKDVIPHPVTNGKGLIWLKGGSGFGVSVFRLSCLVSAFNLLDLGNDH
jgi:hypothetical protein